MSLTDATGHRLSGANPSSLAHFEQAARELLCLVDDPVGQHRSRDRGEPRDDDGSSAEGVAASARHRAGRTRGREGVPALLPRRSTPTSANAATSVRRRRWPRVAGRKPRSALEDLNMRYPRDTLALQVGHQIDFFRGDSRMLRDRIARVLPAWDPAVPGWHAVLGMHAFGLEETGDYAAAEARGRRSVELEPRDSWGWHAVAHVHEMRNAPRDGIAWLEPSRATWSKGSFLGTHNAWHLALCQLELDRHDEVLRLYDEAIGGTGSAVVLDLVDASALLWRLHLRGVALGERGAAIAERWATHGAGGSYAFNDLHAMIAYVLADRPREQQALIEAQQEAMRSDLDNAAFTRDIGHPATLAVQAFGAGDFARAAALLRPVRSGAHRFGGSHAQRDLIDLTLLAAADRAGDRSLAAALAAERLALRPQQPRCAPGASHAGR